LLKGIRVKYGQNILYAEEQKASEKTGKIYTEYRVYLLVTKEKYNEMHPHTPLNPILHKSKYASIPLFRTVKIEELFLYLYREIWLKLESGEMNEQGKRFAEAIRSRRYVRKGEGGSGSTGVLQDAQVGEKLSGNISGSECVGSVQEVPGDIREGL
jgi:hypothetical protein